MEIPTWALVVIAAAIIGLVAFAAYFAGLANQPFSHITVGGNAPSGPAGPVYPTEKNLTFEDLIKGWDKPEDAREFMVKNFQKSQTDRTYRERYTPDELLVVKNDADDVDFAKFFSQFLIQKWGNQWKVRWESLYIHDKGGWTGVGGVFLVVYTDPQSGDNYYMIPKPAEPPKSKNEGFPIYNIGKSILAGPYEEKRLGVVIDQSSYSIQGHGKDGAGSDYDYSTFEEAFNRFSKEGKWPPREKY